MQKFGEIECYCKLTQKDHD